MCVILAGKADKVAKHIPAACAANPHGNGMAWVDTNNGARVIRYVKGISDETALQKAKSLDPDMDIVFHARISTAGSISDELCHPFPIERVPDLSTEGSTDMVLFHNGHVTGWEKLVPEFLLNMEPKRWSDSRAIAHGIAMGFIKMTDLGGKNVPGVYAVLSTEKFPDYPKHFGTIRRFGHWTMIKGGVWASNTHFLYTPSVSYYRSRHDDRRRFARNFYRWEKKYRDWEENLEAELTKLDAWEENLEAELTKLDAEAIASYERAIDGEVLDSEEMSHLAAIRAERNADSISRKSKIIFDNPSTWEPPDSWFNSDVQWDRTTD